MPLENQFLGSNVFAVAALPLEPQKGASRFSLSSDYRLAAPLTSSAIIRAYYTKFTASRSNTWHWSRIRHGQQSAALKHPQ